MDGRQAAPMESKPMSSKRLHLVFGGELVSTTSHEFRDPSAIHVVGIFPDYVAAYDAWKAAAQKSVDNAHVRYFIADLSRLRSAPTATDS